MQHVDREALAAAIKGLSIEEHLERKHLSKTRDPVDDFAAWHERFRHELASEFGPVPEDLENDDGDTSAAIEEYIKSMKKQFRPQLR